MWRCITLWGILGTLIENIFTLTTGHWHVALHILKSFLLIPDNIMLLQSQKWFSGTFQQILGRQNAPQLRYFEHQGKTVHYFWNISKQVGDFRKLKKTTQTTNHCEMLQYLGIRHIAANCMYIWCKADLNKKRLPTHCQVILSWCK